MTHHNWIRTNLDSKHCEWTQQCKQCWVAVLTVMATLMTLIKLFSHKHSVHDNCWYLSDLIIVCTSTGWINQWHTAVAEISFCAHSWWDLTSTVKIFRSNKIYGISWTRRWLSTYKGEFCFMYGVILISWFLGIILKWYDLLIHLTPTGLSEVRTCMYDTNIVWKPD
jgi:hypothetical protein